MSTGAKGKKCECPQCGFKWTRPSGERGKPCPKCQTPFNDSAPTPSKSGPTSKPSLPKTGMAKKSPSPTRKPVEPSTSSTTTEVKTSTESSSPGGGGGTAPGTTGGTSPGGGGSSSTGSRARSVSPPKKTGGDIFSRLTDTSKYTGAHKARFDSDGKGRGLAGRDSVSKGGGSHVSSITGGATAPRGISKSTNTKTGRMTCPTCGYTWARPKDEAGRACPKCNNPV